MPEKHEFDFWYAVNNTEIVLQPQRQLETFGATLVDYHLISQLMDNAQQVRVREGRLQAYRPEIITPRSFMENTLEGFEEAQASQYLDWLRTHEQDLMILKYGFKIKKDLTSEQIITDGIEAVTDRVKADQSSRDKPHSAVLVGVDEPWEVCLLKLLVELVKSSAPHNARDLHRDPMGHHHEIEKAFRDASRDRSRIASLADLLKKTQLFSQYEDRFFALVRGIH
jgi:hypothetical protein